MPTVQFLMDALILKMEKRPGSFYRIVNDMMFTLVHNMGGGYIGILCMVKTCMDNCRYLLYHVCMQTEDE